MRRDKIPESDATQRIRAQMPLSDKVAKADIVVDNSSDLSQLEAQVKQLVNKIRPSTLTWLLEYAGPPAILATAVLFFPRLVHFIQQQLRVYYGA